jgi:hypothetical protein
MVIARRRGREVNMASDEWGAVTDADVRSLAARLKGLHAVLRSGEQALLHAVLRRAATREGASAPDTEGFAWAVSFNPLTYLDAIGEEVRRAQDRRDV